MTSEKEFLFSYLIENFSGFKMQWESEDNYNISDDGTFTVAGLCAEFSQYYIDEFGTIRQQHKEHLFNKIEELLSNSGPRDDLSNCLKSCFIENISQTEAGELSKGFMGNKTRAFFDEWHVYP